MATIRHGLPNPFGYCCHWISKVLRLLGWFLLFPGLLAALQLSIMDDHDPIAELALGADPTATIEAEFESVASDAPASIVELIPEPLAKIVYLDRNRTEHYVVTNSVTLENHTLVGGPWYVAFNPDTGRGIVYMLDEHGEVMDDHAIDDLLKKELCTRSDTNERVICDDLNRSQQPLRLLQCKYREGELELKVGATGAVLKLCIYGFMRKRACGCRLYVDLKSLYKSMQLSQFSGVPSKWVYSSAGRWQRTAATLGSGNIVHGTDTSAQVEEQEKCLPFPGASMPMTIVLLSTWTVQPSNKGGFGLPSHRAAASELLDALCLGACENIPERSNIVEFDLSPKWTSTWPRPSPPTSCVISTQIDHRGIDIAAFAPLDRHRHDKESKDFVVKLCSAFQGEQHRGGLVPVGEFARYLAGANQTLGKPLLGQLSLHLSAALENQSWAQIQGKFKQLDVKLTAKFKFTSMEDSFASKYRVAKLCNDYVMATKTARSSWQFISCSTDKGDGGQLPLQQTVFAFPDNQLFVALPQAGLIDNHRQDSGQYANKAFLSPFKCVLQDVRLPLNNLFKAF